MAILLASTTARLKKHVLHLNFVVVAVVCVCVSGTMCVLIRAKPEQTCETAIIMHNRCCNLHVRNFDLYYLNRTNGQTNGWYFCW